MWLVWSLRLLCCVCLGWAMTLTEYSSHCFQGKSNTKDNLSSIYSSCLPACLPACLVIPSIVLPHFFPLLLIIILLYPFLHSAMPVLERGTGLDRSFYRLPILLVDDFAQLNPGLIRQVQWSKCTAQWGRKVHSTAQHSTVKSIVLYCRRTGG